jgi:hypothetical protein
MQWHQLLEFRVACGTARIDTPEPILRGLEMIEVANAFVLAPLPPALALTDQGVRDRVAELALRTHDSSNVYTYGDRNTGVAVGALVFQEQLAAEVREATLPLLEQLVIDLQPRFEELSRPLVVGAQDFEFTLDTTAVEVIDRADEAVSAAWRAVKPAMGAIAPMVRLRQLISELFEVSPTRAEAATLHYQPQGIWETPKQLDHSVSFAAEHSWSYDGAYYVKGKMPGTLDWMALARGGLKLNTPDEVREKQRAKAAHLISLSNVAAV